MSKLYVLILLLFSHIVLSNHINFEIYEVSNGEKKLIHAENKTYDLTDLQVFEKSIRGKESWKKRLVLWQKFGLNAIIDQDTEISGFGLTIDKDKSGFSWEWFTLHGCCCDKHEESHDKSDYVFEKLQESGAIKIHVNKHDTWEEIIAYEFVEDVTMRGDLGFFGALGGETHRILIKKGSLFTVGELLNAQ